MQFVNYAHRGASEYTPENTLMAFYTGLFMGANGIETDVQRCKDGTRFCSTTARYSGSRGNPALWRTTPSPSSRNFW
jgi:hypothetical protein